jgi:hypothetical protein
MPVCGEQEPALRDVEGHLVACHLYDAALSANGQSAAAGVVVAPS